MPNVVRTVAMCTIINNTWSIATVPSPLLLSPRGHKFPKCLLSPMEGKEKYSFTIILINCRLTKIIQKILTSHRCYTFRFENYFQTALHSKIALSYHDERP